MNRMTIVTALLSLSLGSITIAQADDLADRPSRSAASLEIDIPAQPVGDALNAFAEQFGLQVVLYADVGDGVRTEQFPVDAATLDRAIPIYETIPGWTESTRAITQYDQLNAGARVYIDRLETIVGVQAKIISTGPRREETLVLEDFLAH